MSKPASILPLSAFFQPVLSENTAEKVQCFQGLPMSAYSLVRWGKIFQVLEAEALETPMLYLGVIKRSKGEEGTTYRKILPPLDPVPKVIEETSVCRGYNGMALDLARNGYVQEILSEKGLRNSYG